MGLQVRHLAGGEGVDQVVALDAPGLVPAPFCLQHLLAGGLQLAVDGRLQGFPSQGVLVAVPDIVQGGGEAVLRPVPYVADGLVQP